MINEGKGTDSKSPKANAKANPHPRTQPHPLPRLSDEGKGFREANAKASKAKQATATASRESAIAHGRPVPTWSASQPAEDAKVKVYCERCGRQFAQDFIADARIPTVPNGRHNWGPCMYLARCHMENCWHNDNLPPGERILLNEAEQKTFLEELYEWGGSALMDDEGGKSRPKSSNTPPKLGVGPVPPPVDPKYPKGDARHYLKGRWPADIPIHPKGAKATLAAIARPPKHPPPPWPPKRKRDLSA